MLGDCEGGLRTSGFAVDRVLSESGANSMSGYLSRVYVKREQSKEKL